MPAEEIPQLPKEPQPQQQRPITTKNDTTDPSYAGVADANASMNKIVRFYTNQQQPLPGARLKSSQPQSTA